MHTLTCHFCVVFLHIFSPFLSDIITKPVSIVFFFICAQFQQKTFIIEGSIVNFDKLF
jgi:hypothetical protein